MASTGCGGLVANSAADALSGTGSAFATDEDPELIAEAAPFGLKTMEAVHEQTPGHQKLLLSLVSGFTQYGFAFVAERAHELQEDDYEASRKLKDRAVKLYKRALRYGLKGLDTRHDKFSERLRSQPEKLFKDLDKKDDVPFLYWTAAAWGLSIAASDFSPEEIADFPLAERLARWALALDEDWDDGSVHALMITLEAGRPGGDIEAAERHFERAQALDGGRRAGTYVSMAESVCVKEQDVRRFHKLLDQALSIDVDAYPQDRLVNIIMQRRARRLLAREEDLFLETLEELDSGSEDTLSP